MKMLQDCVLLLSLLTFVGAYNFRYLYDIKYNAATKRCLNGYTGSYCRQKCPYPHYGAQCQERCQCSRHLCSHINGCAHQTQIQKQKLNPILNSSTSLITSTSFKITTNVFQPTTNDYMSLLPHVRTSLRIISNTILTTYPIQQTDVDKQTTRTEIKQVTTEDFLNISKDTVLIKGKLINVMSNSINTDLHSTARLKIPGLKYLPCSMAIAAQRYCH